MKEKLFAYIRGTKVVLMMNLLKILWVLPVRKDSILFLSFDGKQYSDSPKYLCEYIHEKEGGKKRYIWGLDDPAAFSGVLPKWVTSVKRRGFSFLLQFVRAQTIITNNALNSYYPVRKKQIILNTWHGGSPLKTCGMADEASTFYDKIFFRIQERKYTAFLSSSRFMTKEVFKRSMGYHKTILPYGMPRNAILFSKDTSLIRKKVLEYFGLSADEKRGLILYAPTFRGTTTDGAFLGEEDNLDIQRMLDTMKQATGKDYLFLFRAHHAMKMKDYGALALNASDYPDMQELLCASDCLVTDYSSCMGDMALAKKPVFLYTPDLEEYTKDRGFYWDIHELPFPIAETNDQLVTSIINFDDDAYQSGLRSYFDRLKSYESPRSTKLVYDWIKNEWNKKQKGVIQNS